MSRSIVLGLAVAVSTAVFAQAPPGRLSAPVANPLFVATRVASVHLTMAADEFQRLPAQPRRGFLTRLPGQSSFLSQEGGQNGYGGWQFDYVHADATIDGRTFRDVGVRYKGHGTYMQASGKPSYKIDLNRYVKGQKLGDIKTLNLHNQTTDRGYMNEAIAYRLYREAGVPAPRTSYARVYLTVPGRYTRSYAGLFAVVENPDEPFLEARGLPVNGAAIYKPVMPSLFTYFGSDWSSYNQSYDPKTDLSQIHRDRIVAFSRIVTQGSDAEFARAAGEYLDLDLVARYLVLAVFLSDMDGIIGPGQNYYMYFDPRSSRLSLMAWDQDRAVGNYHRGSMADRVNLSVLEPWTGSNVFLRRLFALPDFRQRYLTHFRELHRTVFMPDRIAAEVDRLAPAIRAAIADESADRLRFFDRSVAGTFEPSVKQFTRARWAAVGSQLARAR